MSRLLITVFLLLSLVFSNNTSMAANGIWDDNDHVSTRLISSVDAVGDLTEISFGLEFQLKPDWKIYWRTPGDAGLPPQPDWSGSENVKDVEFRWPLPHRFSVLGLETLGYKNEVIFPLVVTPVIAGEPVHLIGDISYLACSDICIPYTANVKLNLNSGQAHAEKQAHMINKYLAQVPSLATANGLRLDEISQQVMNDEFTLQLRISAGREINNPDVFVEGADGLFFGAPIVVYGSDNVTLTLKGGGVPVTEFSGQPVKLTLRDDAGMTEIIVTPQSGVIDFGKQTETESSSIFGIILIAILGGLILNLMPCVLPVLSLKLLSVVSHGGGDKKHVRIGFLATAAGIIFAFLVLAIVLVLLQTGGIAIGWGIQFQQPVFLIIMVMLLTLFSANMFGLFEFQLPGPMSDMAANAGPKNGLLGHFVAGAFATLLATPCSAPFLGTAVGFALSRGAVEIFIIFAALGLGLSLPYLVVALLPGLATGLPRPGPWMAKLKYILGVSILATALWLLSVLITLMGSENAIIVGSFAALVLAVLWARTLPNSRLGKHTKKTVIILILAAVAVPVFRPVEVQTNVAITEDALWEIFDEAKIQGYVAEGKTVFVDVTADWCITCKFNKKTVMETSDISQWLASDNVIAMRADWTKPNQVIADYLASFGRYGIPFNALYGPTAKQGLPLPELLSIEDIVLASKKVSINNQLTSN